MKIDGGLLERIERRAVWLAAGMAIAAFIIPSGGAPAAAGVLGGALLVGVSYWSIKNGVSGLAAAVLEGQSTRSRSGRSLIMLVGRYALLALIAYVMISRLRLSPIGLLVGASIIPLSATVEALAALKKT